MAGTKSGNRLRIAEGRSRRDIVSRRSHADLNTRERRFNPIDKLLSSGVGRVRQLLPIKYARMQTSPFAFFRGAVAIMANDLARLPNSGVFAQLCGDAHLQNLGSFAAPDGKLVFDLSDFDETIRGPWEWDLKRMAASIVIAGLESHHDRASSKAAAAACVASYCQAMKAFAQLPVLQVARYQVHRDQETAPIHAALRQSERARPLDLLTKLMQADAVGRPRFCDRRPLSWRLRGQAASAVLASLTPYSESLLPERRHLFSLFHSIDVGFKVVGTGSVGLRNYVVMFEGNGTQDPMFLQIKQEVASAYAQFLPPGPAQHQGQRVAEGQRAIQPMSDLLLGWTTIGSHEYLVRQLNDHKGSIELDRLRGAGLTSLAVIAGELLARGHARSGDACLILGYCGAGDKMPKVLADFASQYADQNEADYQAFVKEIKNGKVKVAPLSAEAKPLAS